MNIYSKLDNTYISKKYHDINILREVMNEAEQENNENKDNVYPKIDNIIISKQYDNIISNQNDNDDDSLSNDGKKYMEPTILENINLEKYFTRNDIEKAHLNNKKLKITDKGLYSISKYSDAQWITDNIISFFNGQNINVAIQNIVDGTAGIGGNTINFSKYFKNIHAIEINITHFNVLKNNLDALSIKNVNVYFDNFLNLINNLNSKIFFFDPPWGGKSYKNFKYFNLKIGKLPIYNIINILHDSGYKYVILKAPFNLNLSPIFSSIKYENMNINSNFKKNMILCIFY